VSGSQRIFGERIDEEMSERLGSMIKERLESAQRERLGEAVRARSASRLPWVEDSIPTDCGSRP